MLPGWAVVEQKLLGKTDFPANFSFLPCLAFVFLIKSIFLQSEI